MTIPSQYCQRMIIHQVAIVTMKSGSKIAVNGEQRKASCDLLEYANGVNGNLILTSNNKRSLTVKENND